MISTLYLVHNNVVRLKYMYVVTKVIGWIIQILEYVDIGCNGAKMYLVIFIFPDLFVLFERSEISN